MKKEGRMEEGWFNGWLEGGIARKEGSERRQKFEEGNMN